MADVVLEGGGVRFGVEQVGPERVELLRDVDPFLDPGDGVPVGVAADDPVQPPEMALEPVAEEDTDLAGGRLDGRFRPVEDRRDPLVPLVRARPVPDRRVRHADGPGDRPERAFRPVGVGGEVEFERADPTGLLLDGLLRLHVGPFSGWAWGRTRDPGGRPGGALVSVGAASRGSWETRMYGRLHHVQRTGTRP